MGKVAQLADDVVLFEEAIAGFGLGDDEDDVWRQRDGGDDAGGFQFAVVLDSEVQSESLVEAGFAGRSSAMMRSFRNGGGGGKRSSDQTEIFKLDGGIDAALPSDHRL